MFSDEYFRIIGGNYSWKLTDLLISIYEMKIGSNWNSKYVCALKVQFTNPAAITVSFWCLIIKQALVSWTRQRDLQTLKPLFLPLLAHFSDLMRAVVLKIDLLTADMGQNPSLQLTRGSYMSGDPGLADSSWQWGRDGMLQLAVENIPNSSHHCFSVSCKAL